MPKQIGKIQLFSLKEVSEIIGVREETLKKSSLPFVKCGKHNYITEEKLLEWFKLGHKITG